MAATLVVLSHPNDLSDWGRQTLVDPSFSAYLRKVHDSATEGACWEEFVGVGCCGDTLDVPLVVERVEGDDGVDDDTEFVFEARAKGGVEGGWRVQSAAGPVE